MLLQDSYHIKLNSFYCFFCWTESISWGHWCPLFRTLMTLLVRFKGSIWRNSPGNSKAPKVHCPLSWCFHLESSANNFNRTYIRTNSSIILQLTVNSAKMSAERPGFGMPLDILSEFLQSVGIQTILHYVCRIDSLEKLSVKIQKDLNIFTMGFNDNNLCGVLFNSPFSLINHIQNVTQEKTLRDSFCNRLWSTHCKKMKIAFILSCFIVMVCPDTWFCFERPFDL